MNIIGKGFDFLVAETVEASGKILSTVIEKGREWGVCPQPTETTKKVCEFIGHIFTVIACLAAIALVAQGVFALASTAPQWVPAAQQGLEQVSPYLLAIGGSLLGLILTDKIAEGYPSSPCHDC
jgi:hypothetical protein